MTVKIRDIKTFITRPERSDLVVVKVETTEPGLYGLGCATFTQRATAVKAAVDDYYREIMIGQDVNDIEDAWQRMAGSSYWRNGPVLNNAISGIDEALWDIKGKMAGMPVYQLIGGASRKGVLTFADALGSTKEEIGDAVEKHLRNGFRHIRCMFRLKDAVPENMKPAGAPSGNYLDPKRYIEYAVEVFRYLRERFGDEPELMLDVHEQLTPTETVYLAKCLEPYHLFFLEDSLPPEHPECFKDLRRAVSTPLAMGELFNNVNEYRNLITERDIDYVRCHISQIGGFSPALKLAHFCEYFNVRTAWHCPGDLSPVGCMAQIHLDMVVNNFGIQEWRGYHEATKEVFPGTPELNGIYVYPNDKPGWGVDFDEEAAKKYPGKGYQGDFFLSRLYDGTSVRS